MEGEGGKDMGGGAGVEGKGWSERGGGTEVEGQWNHSILAAGIYLEIPEGDNSGVNTNN